MSQHDHDIANASGAAVRSDLNLVLSAIVTQNSGANEPATTFPYMLWADTSATKLRIRNGANNAWFEIGDLDAITLGLAKLASPALTGTPTAPTPTTADNSTKVATTAHVQAAAQAKVDAHTTIHTVLDGVSTGGRSIYVDTDAPSGGSNGDVWLEY